GTARSCRPSMSVGRPNPIPGSRVVRPAQYDAPMRMAPQALDAVQGRAVAHADGPVLVTGGPGTGKTTMLLERFVRLVESGADPERVALVVLTRRAARAARSFLLDRLDRSLPGLRVLTTHGLAF